MAELVRKYALPDWLDTAGAWAPAFVLRLAFVTNNDPQRVLTWAYLARVLGKSRDVARTRTEKLERLGVLTRELVFSAGGHDAGFRVRVNDDALNQVREYGMFLATAGLATPVTVHAPVVPPAPSVSPAMSTFLDRLASTNAAAAKLITDALFARRVPDRLQLHQAGLDPSEIVVVEEAAATELRRASKAATAAPVTPSVPIVPTVDNNVTTLDALSEQDAVDRAAAQGIVRPVLEISEDAAGYRDIAQLLEREAVAFAPAVLRDQARFARLLPELAYACSLGTLADYGDPLKRVRVAWRLVRTGSWSSPRVVDALVFKRLREGVVVKFTS